MRILFFSSKNDGYSSHRDATIYSPTFRRHYYSSSLMNSNSSLARLCRDPIFWREKYYLDYNQRFGWIDKNQSSSLDIPTVLIQAIEKRNTRLCLHLIERFWNQLNDFNPDEIAR